MYQYIGGIDFMNGGIKVIEESIEKQMICFIIEKLLLNSSELNEQQ